MKTLFIYYSLTGNGDKVAELLRNKGKDTYKVETAKPMPKSFFGKIMVGGFLAGINAKTKLKDFNLDISDYDEIIIGSPVWNARISSPINTVLSKLNFEGKKLSFILYSGSGTAKVAVKKIKKLYKDSSIIILKEPKNDNDLSSKI